jgi:hypothetical protein
MSDLERIADSERRTALFPQSADNGGGGLFDHFICAPHQIERDGNAKGLRSLEIDD